MSTIMYVLTNSEERNAPELEATLPYSHANNPTHWLSLARDARRVAENLTDETARGHMISCAEAYERLAALAEKHPLS